MYHVRAQGVDERMINAHYHYYTDTELRSCVKVEEDLLGSRP